MNHAAPNMVDTRLPHPEVFMDYVSTLAKNVFRDYPYISSQIAEGLGCRAWRYQVCAPDSRIRSFGFTLFVFCSWLNHWTT